MCRKLWISTFTVASLAGLMIISPIAKGESRNMNKQDSKVQPIGISTEQTNTGQTQREVLDYWTPERMRNAKPAMPTVSDTSNSGEARPPQQGRNTKPARPIIPNAPRAEDYWTPERMRNAQPAMPTLPNAPRAEDYWTPERMRNAQPTIPTVPTTPSSGEGSEGSGGR
jgi:hypothetical protein